MNANVLQIILQQAPAIITAVTELLHRTQAAQPGAAPTPSPTSIEVIAAFDAIFADSNARDVFLIAALQAEIASRQPKP